MSKLIVFDGIDDCGKTTVASAVYKYFYDKYLYRKILFIEASSDPIIDRLKAGFFPNDYNYTFLFWMVRQHHQEIINRNDLVIYSRYYDSTYVYQYDEFKDRDHYLFFNYAEDVFKKPDLTFILDVEAEESLKRCSKSVDVLDRQDLKTRQIRRERYLDIVKNQNKWRDFDVINTMTKTADQVIDYCIEKIEEIL